MKQSINLLILCLTLCFTASCANTSNKQVAYKTLATVGYSVDSAMLAWGDYVKAGKATWQDEQVVSLAFDKYIRLYAPAVKMLEGKDAIATTDITDAAANLLQTLRVIKDE